MGKSHSPASFAHPALGDIPPIEIIDVGAAYEIADRYDALIQQNLAHVTAFEPNSAELRKLKARNAPNRTYLPYFIGKGGPETFYFTTWPGCSSLYEPDPGMIELFTSIGALPPEGNYAVTASAPVETKRLDDIAELQAGADYLKADVQGAELDVLQGGTKVLASAVVLEVEVEFVPLYKNQPLFGDVQTFLRGQGFVLHKLIDVAGRPFRPFQVGENPREPMSQLLYADAVFVRDFTRVRTDFWRDDQLLKAAAILFDVYYSHDLVRLLLAEHDRRHGSGRVQRFTEALNRLPQLPRLFMNLKVNS